MKRTIIDYKKLTPELLNKLVEMFPYGYNDEDIIRFRDLQLNTATYQALVGGEPTDLTFMEYELLRFLVENPARVWSRDQILSKVWGYDYFGDGRLVDVHIRRLRTKVEHDPANPRHVVTVRGLGYRLQT